MANSHSRIMSRVSSNINRRQQTLKLTLGLVTLALLIAIPIRYSPAVYAHGWNGHRFHGDSNGNSIHNTQVDDCNTIITADGGSGNGGNGGNSPGGSGGAANGGSGGAAAGASGGMAPGAPGSESNGGNGHGGSSFAGGTTSCSNHATNLIINHR